MAGELTSLGKFLRKLRIDRGELLKTMSEKLGISPSFLSSVENGKKNMPTEWVEKISSIYNLTEQQRMDFDTAIAESEKGVDMKFDGLSAEGRQLTVTFARKIKSLNSQQRDKLQQILFEGLI